MEFIIAAIMAIIPAYMAEKKGRSAGIWYIYGIFLFPIATIHAIVMKNKSGKQCHACKEWIDKEATICRNCKTPQDSYDNSMHNIKN